MPITERTATETVGVCKFCDTEIIKGRRYMPAYDGTDAIVHVLCWDREWDVFMQQKRDQFEREALMQ